MRITRRWPRTRAHLAAFRNDSRSCLHVMDVMTGPRCHIRMPAPLLSPIYRGFCGFSRVFYCILAHYKDVRIQKAVKMSKVLYTYSTKR